MNRKLAALILLPSLSFGAASIQMNTITIAADGQTVTVGMTGFTGSLSPSSGITGFTCGVTQNGNFRNDTVSNATASGANITLSMKEPLARSADETITFSLATVGGGSNLTDSASNTPTGQSNVSPTTNNSEWYDVGGSGFMTSAIIDNGINTTNTYPQVAQFQSFDGKIRFNANITGINIFGFNYDAHYVLNQDSAPIGDFSQFSGNTVWSTGTYITGLSGTHLYEIAEVTPNGPSEGDVVLARVRITGSLGTIPDPVKMVSECGDSLPAIGGNNPVSDTRSAHMWLSSYGLGIADIGMGYAGASVYATLQTWCPTYMVNFGQTPTLVYLQGSNNDTAEIAASGETIAEYQAAVDNYISSMQGNAQPATHYVYEGLTYQTNYVTNANVDTLTGYLKTEVTKYTNICYTDERPWIGGLEDRQPDGIHLTGAGELLMANNLIPITAGYVLGKSYNFSGPTSGSPGSASSNFTVSRASGTWALWQSGNETITLSDNGSGGTFNVTGGTTSGTDPMIVTPTVGNSSFTFTYTPSGSGGNRIITTTNSQQCWTNPSPLTYTVSGANAILNGTSVIKGSVTFL